MQVFPSTPEPTYPLSVESSYRTLTTNFESGKEQRRQAWTIPKRELSLQFSILSQDEIDLLYNFFQQQRGSLEPFWFLSPFPETYVGEYVGRGNGSLVTFELPGKDVVGPTTGSNLIANGAFTSDTSSWTADVSTLASVSGGESGNCLQVTRSSGTWQGAYQEITVTAGTTYRLRVAVKSGSSGNEAFELRLGSPGYTFTTVSGTTSAIWTFYEITNTAATATLQIYLKKNTATAGTMLFDTVTVYEVPEDGIKVYQNGTEVPFAFLTGGGDAGADRVQFTNAPSSGAMLTADFKGTLRMKMRFKEDKLSKELFAYVLYNSSLSLIEVR